VGLDPWEENLFPPPTPALPPRAEGKETATKGYPGWILCDIKINILLIFYTLYSIVVK
jgi:hypothetical protein